MNGDAMRNRPLSAALLCAFANFTLGCAVPALRLVSDESAPHLTSDRITQVVLVRREVEKFDAEGDWYHEKYEIQQRLIIGKTEEGKPVVIGLDQALCRCLAKDHAAAENRDEASSALFLLVLMALVVVAFASGSSGR